MRLVVTDAGDGVPPAERESVFDPFHRPNGYGEAAGGWGLGLALVRQIAERHGGGVACEDDPAGGSRFVVDLVAWTRTEGTDGMPAGPRDPFGSFTAGSQLSARRDRGPLVPNGSP